MKAEDREPVRGTPFRVGERSTIRESHDAVALFHTHKIRHQNSRAAGPHEHTAGHQSRGRPSHERSRSTAPHLHTIALVQVRTDPRVKAYVARHRAAGESYRDAVRALERRLSDVVWRQLRVDGALKMSGPLPDVMTCERRQQPPPLVWFGSATLVQMSRS